MSKARDLADRTAADLTAVTAGTGIAVTDGAGPIPTVAVTSSIVTLTDTQELTNKTISAASNTLTGVVTETGTQTLTNKTLTGPVVTLSQGAQTASYTAVITDASKLISMDVSTANDFRIPANTSVAFPIGTVINVIQYGAGKTTIKANSSNLTTVLSTGATTAAPALRAVFSAASCIKTGEDTWYVIGDIS